MIDKLYIIDASGYLYRSYFAIPNITNSKGESTNALFGFIRSVQKLFKDFHPKYVVSVFDGERNAARREAIYSEYKAHRAAAPGDLYYQIAWAHRYCELMGIPQLNIPEVEADDTMASVTKWAENLGSTVYLCTSDKDMGQLVNEKVFLLNTHKDNRLMGPKEVEEVYGVPPQQIIDFLSITGDSSDNIPGLSGFGPKTAAALLKQFNSLENILNSVDQIPGKKKQETLVKEADLAILSKQLVALDTCVDIPIDPNFYMRKPPDLVPLKEFYSSMSFNSLLKELDTEEKQGGDGILLAQGQKTTVEEIPVHYSLVDDDISLKELVCLLEKQSQIAMRAVTTDAPPLRADLVGLSFSVEEAHAFYVPLTGTLGLEKVLLAFKPLFENPSIGFYGHNMKSDYLVLQQYEITIANISFDTILASYLLNSHSRRHSLDFLLLEYFGKVKGSLDDILGKGKKAIELPSAPPQGMCSYCCEEVDYIYRLKKILEKQLHERKLFSLLTDLELPLLLVLAHMEKRGIYLDVPHLKMMSEKVCKDIGNIETSIYELAGEKFNLNSPKQLSQILFEKLGIKAIKKTTTGHSTNVDVLEALKKDYPIAEKILEYRSLEKLRSTYIDALPAEVYPHTRRIHCTFNQSVTATGRLASQEPNLQNIPVRTTLGKQIRAAFCPENEGWCLMSADYSQIELRLLAHLSGDPLLVEAFMKNEDVHKFTAATIFNLPLESVTAQQRQQAKAVNFGVIYGQQAFGLSQGLDIEYKEAAEFIEMYFNRYKRVKEFLEENKVKAHREGKAVTMLGRERLIPEINSKNPVFRAAAERLAINTPLQGTAADLIKLAMIRIDKLLKENNMKSFMILQIHDELLFEVLEEEKETVRDLVRDAMENVWQLQVPLVVDISIGKNWELC